MISETKVYHCTRCGSSNIVRNGYNSAGSPKYLCKDCKASQVLKPKVRYTLEQREQILRAYQERTSLWALQRLFGACRPTLIRWIKKKASSLPEVKDTLLAAQGGDVLELDEMCSYVGKKSKKVWL